MSGYFGIYDGRFAVNSVFFFFFACFDLVRACYSFSWHLDACFILVEKLIQ